MADAKAKAAQQPNHMHANPLLPSLSNALVGYIYIPSVTVRSGRLEQSTGLGTENTTASHLSPI